MDNVPDSLRLFSICQRMEWNHLPVAGGIYDQHPQLLAEWTVIWEAQTRHEAREKARRN